MRKLFLGILFSLASASIFSQVHRDSTFTTSRDTSVVITENQDKHKVETNRFWSNWFVNIGGGAQILFGDHNKQMQLKHRFTPAFDLSFGKWFTPVIAVRAGVQGYNLNGVSAWSNHKLFDNIPVYQDNYTGFIKNAQYDATKKHYIGDIYDKPGHYTLYKTNMKYLNAHLDAMFNLMNLFGGYKPDRFYSLIPYAGLGWGRSLNTAIFRNPLKVEQNYFDEGKRTNEVSANAGLYNEFRLSNSWALMLDIRGTYVNDRFDQQLGGRWGEGILSGYLGLTYKINQTDWGRSREIDRTVNIENTKIIKEILREEKLKEESSQLILLLANVTFDFDQDVITPRAAEILDEAAEILKKMPKNRFLITGHTDIRGSAEYNENLSARRADAVVKALEERGVPTNVLKSRGIGKRATTMPYEESHEIREGDRKVTIELIQNMDYWNKLPKRSY